MSFKTGPDHRRCAVARRRWFRVLGLLNVAADAPHWGLTTRLQEAAREYSISSRAREVGLPPALKDAQRMAVGAQEHDEMCTGCHLAPGMKDSELRAGL